MWKRRASWNDGSVSTEDIPTQKMKRFQSVVTQVVKTVKARKQEILDVRRDTYNVEASRPASDLDIDNFEDMLKMAHDAEMKRRDRQSKFFVETAPKMYLKKENPKAMMKEVMKTIGMFERDYRQQMEQVQAVQEEEDEEEEEPVEPVKSPPKASFKPPPKPSILPTRVVGAKIDTGLRPKIAPVPEKPLEPTTKELTSPSITITFHEDESSRVGSPVAQPQEELFRKSQYEEDADVRESISEESSVEIKPEEQIHITPLQLITKTKEHEFKRKVKQLLAQQLKHEEMSASSMALAQIPSLEVVGITQNIEGLKKGGKEYQTKQKQIHSEEASNLPRIEIPVDDSLTDVKTAMKSAPKEEIGTAPEMYGKTNDLLTILEDVRFSNDNILPESMTVERRLVRTAEDRRFSRVKIQLRTSANKKPKTLKEWEMMEEAAPHLENLNKKTLKSIADHQRRISGSWKENARQNLKNQISTLPSQLRKEYIYNHLNNGKQGDVYQRVQNEQMARKRLQTAQIMAEATKRENDIKEMKAIALEEEIVLLEERVRRSTPSAKVIQEEKRRDLLKKYYKDLGIISSKDYWREAPKRKTLVMKEYIPETTFENILNQRGFFGRRVKRESSVIYVPTTNLTFDKFPPAKQAEQYMGRDKPQIGVQVASPDMNKKTMQRKEKESKWKILKRRLPEIIDLMKKKEIERQKRLVSINEINEAMDEILGNYNNIQQPASVKEIYHVKEKVLTNLKEIERLLSLKDIYNSKDDILKNLNEIKELVSANEEYDNKEEVLKNINEINEIFLIKDMHLTKDKVLKNLKKIKPIVSAKDLSDKKVDDLKNINQVKPIIYEPFKYRVSEKRGKIRNPDSLINVSATKDMKLHGPGKKESEELLLIGKAEKEVKAKTPKVATYRGDHRFSNKTNKGFMKEFIKDVYDVSRPCY